MPVSELAQMECIPCKGGIPPLKGEPLSQLLGKLGNEWQVVDEHHLEKKYKFGNFRQALDFTNRVGELAESVNHHPDICLSWGKVKNHALDAQDRRAERDGFRIRRQVRCPAPSGRLTRT